MRNTKTKAKKVGILVVADRISDEVKNRFIDSINFSNPQPECKIIMMENERDEDQLFNKCKLLNKGLKIAFKENFDVIIQTDIDLVIPPNTINFTCNVALEGMVCCHLPMRRILKKEFDLFEHYDDYPWDEWIKKYSPIYATGCWNGLVPKAWKMTGGFNEDMLEWGYEDRDWRMRAIKNNVVWRDKWKWGRTFPIMHVNHLPRTLNMSSENRKVGKSKRRDWLS